MKRLLTISAALGAALLGCTRGPLAAKSEGRALTIFAAASLTDAFTEIGAGFEAANPGVEITFSFSGSQTLRTQIEAGAPADVFASANSREMDALVASGLVRTGVPQVFLSNALIVIVPSANPAAITQLQDLSRRGIKLVLAAEEVPAGTYARAALEKMNGSLGPDFKAQVLANVVSNEDNVRQVVAKVQLGEADAGIVYRSDAVAAPGLKAVEIPAELNVLAEYPIAVVSDTVKAALAQGFVDYVLSPAGQAVLRKWGFGPSLR